MWERGRLMCFAKLSPRCETKDVRKEGVIVLLISLVRHFGVYGRYMYREALLILEFWQGYGLVGRTWTSIWCIKHRCNHMLLASEKHRLCLSHADSHSICIRLCKAQREALQRVRITSAGRVMLIASRDVPTRA